MGIHERPGKNQEWYSPQYLFVAMEAKFDMDVASPGAHVTWWIPAKECITEKSLEREWKGFVWMNPPFGGRNGLMPWLQKFVAHGNGIALVPDRTSAPWWQQYAPQMDSILFVAHKIKFIDAEGNIGKSPANGTTLMALGTKGEKALEMAEINGLGFVFKRNKF